MKEPNHLQKMLLHPNPSLDSSSKNIFKHKVFLALVLHLASSKYFDKMDINQLIAHAGTPLQKESLHEEDLLPWVHSSFNEDHSYPGIVVYDCKVDVLNDEGKEMIADIEIQRVYSPWIGRRWFYYLFRIGSSQKDSKFSDQNYKDLQDICLIVLYPLYTEKSAVIRTNPETTLFEGEMSENRLNTIAHDRNRMFELVEVFIGSDYYNSQSELIRTLGEIFRNPDRKQAVEYLRSKGIPYEKEIEQLKALLAVKK